MSDANHVPTGVNAVLNIPNILDARYSLQFGWNLIGEIHFHVRKKTADGWEDWKQITLA